MKTRRKDWRENNRLLAEFRARDCEWCRRRGPCDAHHVFGRGAASGKRLDIRIALAALCRTCHNEVHAGKILQCDLLAIVARREKCLQGDIEAVVRWLRSLPKDPLPCQWEAALKELTEAQRELVERTRREATDGI